MVPPPDTTEKVPPAGVAVSVLVVFSQIAAVLVVLVAVPAKTFTVTVPDMVAAVHGAVCPEVVIVYVPEAVGVPLIVTVLAVVSMLEVNPAGKPVTAASVALPLKVYTVLIIGDPEHTF